MAPRRGGGEENQLLDYQTDVRKGRFDKPTKSLNVVLRVLPWEMRKTSQGQCCGGAKQTTEGEWRERAKAPKKEEKTVETISVLASAGSI